MGAAGTEERMTARVAALEVAAVAVVVRKAVLKVARAARWGAPRAVGAVAAAVVGTDLRSRKTRPRRDCPSSHNSQTCSSGANANRRRGSRSRMPPVLPCSR